MRKLLLLGLAALGVACSKPSGGDNGDVIMNIDDIQTLDVSFGVTVGAESTSSNKSASSARTEGENSTFEHVFTTGQDQLTLELSNGVDLDFHDGNSLELPVGGNYEYDLRNQDVTFGYSTHLPLMDVSGSFIVTSTVSIDATTEWGLYTVSSENATITYAYLDIPDADPEMLVTDQDGFDRYIYVKDGINQSIAVEYEYLDAASMLATGTTTSGIYQVDPNQHRHFVFTFVDPANTTTSTFAVSVTQFVRTADVEFTN